MQFDISVVLNRVSCSFSISTWSVVNIWHGIVVTIGLFSSIGVFWRSFGTIPRGVNVKSFTTRIVPVCNEIRLPVVLHHSPQYESHLFFAKDRRRLPTRPCALWFLLRGSNVRRSTQTKIKQTSFKSARCQSFTSVVTHRERENGSLEVTFQCDGHRSDRWDCQTWETLIIVWETPKQESKLGKGFRAVRAPIADYEPDASEEEWKGEGGGGGNVWTL